VILDAENEFQPDTNLRVLPSHGGRGSDADRYIMHAPELVVEVAHTTERIDLNQKFDAYQKSGALEYLVHLVREPAVKWFVLKNGVYELLPCDKSGVIRSETFPGLWLNTRALIKRDLRGMLKTLEKGLASPEHAAFCKRLAAAKRNARKTR
jgi:Uma2 family endonuclease